MANQTHTRWSDITPLKKVKAKKLKGEFNRLAVGSDVTTFSGSGPLRNVNHVSGAIFVLFTWGHNQNKHTSEAHSGDSLASGSTGEVNSSQRGVIVSLKAKKRRAHLNDTYTKNDTQSSAWIL